MVLDRHSTCVVMCISAKQHISAIIASSHFPPEPQSGETRDLIAFFDARVAHKIPRNFWKLYMLIIDYMFIIKSWNRYIQIRSTDILIKYFQNHTKYVA